MILDNTNRMYPSGQPQSYLRSKGLGDATSASDATTIFGLSTTDIQTLLTGINSQQLFQLNLERAQAGLPPLNPATYAPGVTVGLNSQTQTLVLLGGAAILAAFLFSKKRS